MRKQENWCGETHIQKATYLLQKIFHVPLEFDYILYKHGPFSFDLRDELTALRTDGPRFAPTELSDLLQKRFPKTFDCYALMIDSVVEIVKDKGVQELERLTTALYVTMQNGGASSEKRAEQLIGLKPHIAPSEASFAVKEADNILARAHRVNH